MNQYLDTSKTAKGGTELMKKWVFERLNPELRDAFEWHITHLGEFKSDRPKLLWIHDNYESASKGGYLAKKEIVDQFEKIIFVSHTQKESFRQAFNLPLDKLAVLQNAILPIPDHQKPALEKIKLIYDSTPHRGLDVLLTAFEFLCQHRNDIELDVYSSFKIYDWPDEADAQFEKLYEKARTLEHVNYFGTVDNDTVRKALESSHIFAYPSTYYETSCLCLIEAMSAGCLCVIPDYAALPETAANFAWLYPMTADKGQHAARFAEQLNQAVEIVKSGQNASMMSFQKNYFNAFYSIDRRAGQWNAFLKKTLHEFQTKSR